MNLWEGGENMTRDRAMCDLELLEYCVEANKIHENLKQKLIMQKKNIF